MFAGCETVKSGVVVVFPVRMLNFADIASTRSCDCSVKCFLRWPKQSAYLNPQLAGKCLALASSLDQVYYSLLK